MNQALVVNLIRTIQKEYPELAQVLMEITNEIKTINEGGVPPLLKSGEYIKSKTTEGNPPVRLIGLENNLIRLAPDATKSGFGITIPVITPLTLNEHHPGVGQDGMIYIGENNFLHYMVNKKRYYIVGNEF